MSLKKLTITIELEGEIDDNLTIETIKDALQNGGDRDMGSMNPRYHDVMFQRNQIRSSICSGKFSMASSELVRPDLLVKLGRQLYDHYRSDLEIITVVIDYGYTILIRVGSEVHTWIRENAIWRKL